MQAIHLWRIFYTGVCITLQRTFMYNTYSCMRNFHDDYPQYIQHTWQLAVWLGVKCKKYKLGFQTDLNSLNMETSSNHYVLVLILTLNIFCEDDIGQYLYRVKVVCYKKGPGGENQLISPSTQSQYLKYSGYGLDWKRAFWAYFCENDHFHAQNWIYEFGHWVSAYGHR